MNRFVIVQSELGLWTIGHYKPDGEWEPLEDRDDKTKAMQLCAWLNGSGEIADE